MKKYLLSRSWIVETILVTLKLDWWRKSWLCNETVIIMTKLTQIFTLPTLTFHETG